MADIIAEHFGYDDHQGHWYETYSGKIEGIVPVVSNPYPYLNSEWFEWAVLSTEDDDD